MSQLRLQIRTVLSVLLLASVVSLSIGGYLLYVYSLVPKLLVETTFAAIVVLLVLSYFVRRGVMIAINVGTVLGVIAPFITFSTPAHVGVIEQILSGGLISLLGLLQILGFDVFPVLYVILRIVYRGRINTPCRSNHIKGAK